MPDPKAQPSNLARVETMMLAPGSANQAAATVAKRKAHLREPARTIGELADALKRRALATANGMAPSAEDGDPPHWPGVDRLSGMVLDRTGRTMDWSATTWVEARLRRCGQPDPEAVSIASAADLIEASTELICPRCGGTIEDQYGDSNACQRCREAATASYDETMGPLVMRAACVGRGILAEADFVAEIGPSIRNLAAMKFGHPTFSMVTWRRLCDWLGDVHPCVGNVSGMLRSRVVELLRGQANAGQANASIVPTSHPTDVGFGAIVLRGIENTPLVFNQEVDRLTQGRYRDVKALVRACSQYHSMEGAMRSVRTSDLIEVFGAGVSFARSYKHLRANSMLWNAAISVAVSAWGGYGIAIQTGHEMADESE